MTDRNGKAGRAARLRRLRVLGAGTGIALAAAGALGPMPAGGGRLPDGVVATVNSRAIDEAALARAVFLVRARNPEGEPEPGAAEVLDRLVDEELLIQRGIDVGLLDSDSNVRKTVARATIDSIANGAPRSAPSEERLRALYDSDPGFFAPPARLHLRQIFFRSAGDPVAALRRAEEARRALDDGLDFELVRSRYGDEETVPIPDTMLPAQTLSRELGRSLTEAALQLQPGETTAVIAGPAGYHVLQLLERSSGEPPPFERVRAQVASEFERRSNDERLRNTLQQLWKDADIVLSPGAPF